MAGTGGAVGGWHCPETPCIHNPGRAPWRSGRLDMSTSRASMSFLAGTGPGLGGERSTGSPSPGIRTSRCAKGRRTAELGPDLGPDLGPALSFPRHGTRFTVPAPNPHSDTVSRPLLDHFSGFGALRASASAPWSVPPAAGTEGHGLAHDPGRWCAGPRPSRRRHPPAPETTVLRPACAWGGGSRFPWVPPWGRARCGGWGRSRSTARRWSTRQGCVWLLDESRSPCAGPSSDSNSSALTFAGDKLCAVLQHRGRGDVVLLHPRRPAPRSSELGAGAGSLHASHGRHLARLPCRPGSIPALWCGGAIRPGVCAWRELPSAGPCTHAMPLGCAVHGCRARIPPGRGGGSFVGRGCRRRMDSARQPGPQSGLGAGQRLAPAQTHHHGRPPPQVTRSTTA